MPESTASFSLLSMQTLAIGATVVGVNAAISAVMVSVSNWLTQRALKKMDQASRAKGLPECNCLHCPKFDQCLGKGK